MKAGIVLLAEESQLALQNISTGIPMGGVARLEFWVTFEKYELPGIRRTDEEDAAGIGDCGRWHIVVMFVFWCRRRL